MPSRAPHPCGRPLCPALVQGRFCAPHQLEWDKHHSQERGTTAARGYGARWAAYSRQYRRRHPFCVGCADRRVKAPSGQVDHITPVSGPDDPLFWDPRNHQALCGSCHSRKTVVVDKRGIGAQW